MAEKVQAVRIETTRVNKYTTIVRSCMTASNAAATLGEGKMYEALTKVMELADSCRKEELMLSLGSGPAQG